MIFGCEGRIYDTGGMTAYDTGDPAMPTIFVDPQEAGVFLVTLNRWSGVRVRRAAEREIHRLAELYHLPCLRPLAGPEPLAPRARLMWW